MGLGHPLYERRRLECILGLQLLFFFVFSIFHHEDYNNGNDDQDNNWSDDYLEECFNKTHDDGGGKDHGVNKRGGC
ncbi:hypothetical protein P175DRAFT_0345949 [Aspergillus ochraceoroseus IBT 24754]|uniref:Uncharacterized protein n=1 Tax=Aspergillus ochraceoroseus IBT 24754 TaxID=1392256 RepID=A0A2T5LP11_9EURO|nr:uncharacterized protein P175DRAFT_0345949 [Aspergillus ochraceoroseus IBT 24754]PTU18022.1 hypothetical protein P175DRAFT_0345949 [Aspergillus ochraceoroseus IBT 24754]